MAEQPDFDVAVVGGGPAGATAARRLAQEGASVLLLDRAGRIKPCGGAIPPRCIEDFDIPPHLLTARIRSARIVAPSRRSVDMVIGTASDRGNYVGMVDRDVFDGFLRERAGEAGAERRIGVYAGYERCDGGLFRLTYRHRGVETGVTARGVIGADGANSAVRRQAFKARERPPYVFAYHEIVRSPARDVAEFDPARCDVVYQGDISPDFYGWVFPHGGRTSVGVGSAAKGFDLKQATALLRERAGLAGVETIRAEGAPLPLKPMKRWDDGTGIILAGDAAGVVAPSSGEGIYYAMLSGALVADAVLAFLKTGEARALGGARRAFMRDHGATFLILGMMQYFWYASDARRERFVAMCRDPDVQRLTWESYLNKRLSARDPLAHARIFMKDMSHLLGLATP